ncbi:MAG: hypothetical protein Q9222_004473 [Ikaeria aurantiellina]
MVTGVETAGLVLALLPLLIKGLQSYLEGVQPVKNFVKFKPLVRELISSLETQTARLRCTCEHLLSGIVKNDVKLANLLDNPTGTAWTENSLTVSLQEKLGRSYNAFLTLMETLSATLDELGHNLGIESHDQTWQFKKQLQWVEAKLPKQYRKRFVLCLRHKEHESLIARIKSQNEDLRHIVEDSLDLEVPRSQRRKIRSISFQGVRSHATKLYNVLRSGFSCGCNTTHCAELRLEAKGWGQLPHFRMTFPIPNTPTSPRTCHETEIRVTEKVTTPAQPSQHLATNPQANAPPSEPRFPRSLKSLQTSGKRVAFAVMPGFQAASSQIPRHVLTADLAGDRQESQNQPFEPEIADITSLCSTLRQNSRSSQISSGTCIGKLTDQDSHYQVYTLSHVQDSNPHLSSLSDILPHSLSLPSREPRLTRKARLRLSIILAYTVLQLDTTPWLQSLLRCENIKFRQGKFDCPYIITSFPESPLCTISGASNQSWGRIRNQAIFSLGVLLIEISLGRPFRDDRRAEQLFSDEDFHDAKNMIQYLDEEEFVGYLEAVEACISGTFRCKVQNVDLENDALRQAVYEQIVVPLEELLESYSRGT